MADSTLTPERILEAAEEVLRRFGPAKATVVDVARALGVSHGSVYRHFASKTALREAVADRWLDRVHADLPAVTASTAPAPERLRSWLHTLHGAKRVTALDDPELFATYIVLVGEASTVIAASLDGLVAQLSRIIADGVADGDFAVGDVPRAARAVLHATARFHDPTHSAQWADPEIEQQLDAVCDLLLDGLRPR
ncbi:TetR family transcriptional regulator [Plantactinospora sp. KLBMP9567]|uniref:TetR family transcriptional regulator n=1 Tax=Plantactinospora sp. KLBMP9567 TaxID=3085900 RepID=UPI0029815ECE|nr:TetR family transcriptional regulator [Plantactinospora sp. KLBMP9567]MDW5325086.1 TetR family transcriptional regulator [Plantactinospora sp. KLBMP9567]MDW5329287.1 TetR family transcriptional regulator [Plantactinospora sp. KLBMP9567]